MRQNRVNMLRRSRSWRMLRKFLNRSRKLTLRKGVNRLRKRINMLRRMG